MVSGVNQRNEWGGEFKISLCYPRGSEASPQSFREGGGVFSSCGVFVDG